MPTTRVTLLARANEKKTTRLILWSLLATSVSALGWVVYSNFTGIPSAFPETLSSAGVAQAEDHPIQTELDSIPEPKAQSLARPGNGEDAGRAPVVEPSTQRIERMQTRMEDLARSEHWDEKYRSLDESELMQARDRLEKAIHSSTHSYFEKRNDAGEGEMTDQASAHAVGVYNPLEITWLIMLPDERVRKLVLPEEGYQQEYRMRAESYWLQERAFSLKASSGRR